MPENTAYCGKCRREITPYEGTPEKMVVPGSYGSSREVTKVKLKCPMCHSTVGYREKPNS